jgi:hypothetical protein
MPQLIHRAFAGQPPFERSALAQVHEVMAKAPRDRARRSRSTTDTGAFWFFAAANVELIVKVLDGCALNGAHWVFATRRRGNDERQVGTFQAG